MIEVLGVPQQARVHKRGVRQVCSFHHHLRGQFRGAPQHLVRLEAFFHLFDMEEELSSLFEGRKVDLRTPQDLSRYFRDEVLAGAEIQYARS
ncbi:MAG: nucleotidyltransferase [Candidatus Latescibacteria bacterium]|nr:nucleotidyltransferase [Candidatus Latescibacterota bacterium]